MQYWRYKAITDPTGGKSYFGSQFPRFQSMMSWLHCLQTCDKAPHLSGNKKRRIRVPKAPFIVLANNFP